MAEANKPSWLTVNQAWQQLAEAAPLAELEKHLVSINQAIGKTLAESPVSLINVPPADNSAMDGFAVCLADCNTDQQYSISQRIPAGAKTSPLLPGTVARIFTGSEIPENADTVIIQEHANYDDNQASFSKLPEPGANIRRSGEDIAQHQPLLPVGHRIRPQDVGLLAAAGIAEVCVYRPLSIALVATGDELVEPGIPLSAGKIYESNSHMLAPLLTGLGYQISIHRCEDDPEQTRQTLLNAAEQCDVIITIGGVSVGEEDHVKNALEQLGSINFWKIGLKPGKPFVLGHIDQTPVLGLPGNPVSAFLTCCLFCKPFLRVMQGSEFRIPQHWNAIADFDRPKPDARQQYLRGKFNDGKASLLAKQSSAVMTSLCEADVLVIIPAETPVKKGDLLQVISLLELVNYS